MATRIKTDNAEIIAKHRSIGSYKRSQNGPLTPNAFSSILLPMTLPMVIKRELSFSAYMDQKDTD